MSVPSDAGLVTFGDVVVGQARQLIIPPSQSAPTQPIDSQYWTAS